MSNLSNNIAGLYDPSLEKSSCGVGFLTRKDGKQTHELLVKGHQALCAVPHRGGMSSEGVGDGAGICVDLSTEFFSKMCGIELEAGDFGVGNFFMPDDPAFQELAITIIERALAERDLQVLTQRDVPVCEDRSGARSAQYQLAIKQWVFAAPQETEPEAFERLIHGALLDIEAQAYTNEDLAGLYPLSMSSRTQVYKGRLNSGEIVPYFADLFDPSN